MHTGGQYSSLCSTERLIHYGKAGQASRRYFGNRESSEEKEAKNHQEILASKLTVSYRNSVEQPAATLHSCSRGEEPKRLNLIYYSLHVAESIVVILPSNFENAEMSSRTFLVTLASSAFIQLRNLDIYQNLSLI